MAKKAQITIFIVIGLAILIFAALLIYYTTVSEKEEIEFERIDTTSVQSFVDSCFESALSEAVVLVSMQGGYNESPPQFYQFRYLQIAYYHTIDTGDISPEKEDIEAGISDYIEANIKDCLDNFSVFIDKGYSIDEGDIEVSTTFNMNNVIAEMQYPIDIRLDEDSAELESFYAVTDLPIGKLYYISQLYMEKQKQKPNFVRLTPLLDICANNNLSFDTIYDGDTVVFTLVDYNNNLSEDVPYIFNFAVKYNWSYLKVG